MVDAVHLARVEVVVQRRIELSRAFPVVAEWLLDNEPAERSAVLLTAQARLTQDGRDGFIEIGLYRQVIDPVGRRASFRLLQPIQKRLQPFAGSRVAGDVP